MLPNLDEWLPQDDDPGKSYPVLYMYDGHMLLDVSNTWNNQEWDVDGVASQPIRNGKMKPCQVVSPGKKIV